jgi:DNA-directed RNA polymerase subunit H (RpoH/RPB5)
MSSINPLLLPVKKDVDTIRNTVLTNIVEMLSERKWIKRENVQAKIKSLVESHTDDFQYKIPLDVNLNELLTYDPTESDLPADAKVVQKKVTDGRFLMLKIFPQKITGVNKSPVVAEFVNAYKQIHKILIVESISDKAKHQLLANGRTEVFKEVFFLQKLLDLVCSPQYELLDPEQGKMVLEEYGLTKKQMKKILDNDPGALYYYGKTRQILRVIRNNELTGNSIDYRIIIHKG